VSHPTDSAAEEFKKAILEAQREHQQKSRRPTASQGPPSPADVPVEPPAAPPPPVDWRHIDPQKLTLDELEKLFAAAHGGDADAAETFGKFMDDGGSALWRQAGDIAGVAEKALLTAVYRKSPTLCISGRRRIRELRAELASEHATPLEKLAIERVVLASTFAHAIDAFVAMQGPEGLLSAKLVQAQQHAERRVTAALKSLKTAREIGRPAIVGPVLLFGSRVREHASSPTAITG
jgi:hypothetical protein